MKRSEIPTALSNLIEQAVRAPDNKALALWHMNSENVARQAKGDLLMAASVILQREPWIHITTLRRGADVFLEVTNEPLPDE